MECLKSINVNNVYHLEMEQTFSSLHPNPGWANCELGNRSGAHNPSSEDIVGKHCILELYGCDQTKLNDEAFVRTRVTYASKIAGAKLLNLITHRFQPQGVTGLALLAESHISIHTWPELSYAAIDVFTCGQKTIPEKACESLATDFIAKSHSLKCFVRETPIHLLDSTREPVPNKCKL